MTTSPAPDRVTALYDAIDGFQRQHRTGGGLQHAQIRALLAEHLDAALPATTDQAAALSPAERTMLNYALNQAQLRLWSKGGFTGEEQAALVSLRRLTAEQPVAGARQDEPDHVCNSVMARGEMDEPLGYQICGLCGTRKNGAQR